MADEASPFDAPVNTFALDTVGTLVTSLPARKAYGQPTMPLLIRSGLLGRTVDYDAPAVLPMVTIKSPTTRFDSPGLTGYMFALSTFGSEAGWADTQAVLRHFVEPVTALHGAIYGENPPKLRWAQAYRDAIERHTFDYTSAYRLGRAVTAISAEMISFQFEHIGLDPCLKPMISFGGLRVSRQADGTIISEKCEPML